MDEEGKNDKKREDESNGGEAGEDQKCLEKQKMKEETMLQYSHIPFHYTYHIADGFKKRDGQWKF